ncbi:hypothetical protein THASP1DRAFT_22419 [Thamnocephalis sphaerospora]|uniref:Uncharacterized protein n=1 Tax=Thamnocephalis sphaerospora TaxID=78915 RepID=A0A4P9XU78_9FUNG|nr:hypothetical protein THASP1DRAFT_22419 [Thamnocephalis sphaerospora]|eukprot:RKP09774.1 hypothetical protein THASP1DRAFT_22419 [Thamnocephalis sphaerospora]
MAAPHSEETDTFSEDDQHVAHFERRRSERRRSSSTLPPDHFHTLLSTRGQAPSPPSAAAQDKPASDAGSDRHRNDETGDGDVASDLPTPPPATHPRTPRQPDDMTGNGTNGNAYPQRHIGFHGTPTGTPPPILDTLAHTDASRHYHHPLSVEQQGPIGFVKELALAARDAVTDIFSRVRLRNADNGSMAADQAAAGANDLPQDPTVEIPQSQSSHRSRPLSMPYAGAAPLHPTLQSADLARRHSLRDLPDLFPLHGPEVAGSGAAYRPHATASQPSLDHPLATARDATLLSDPHIVQAVSLSGRTSTPDLSLGASLRLSSDKPSSKVPAGSKPITLDMASEKPEWHAINQLTSTLELPREETVVEAEAAHKGKEPEEAKIVLPGSERLPPVEAEAPAIDLSPEQPAVEETLQSDPPAVEAVADANEKDAPAAAAGKTRNGRKRRSKNKAGAKKA